MTKLYNVAFAATMLVGLSFLSGCQISNSGSSTYAGSAVAAKSNQGSGTKTSSRVKIGLQSRSVEEGVDTYADAIANKPSIKRGIVDNKKPVAKRSKLNEKRKVSKGKKKSKNIKSNRRYDAIIRRYARTNGVPYNLARAVVQVESGFRRNARGKVGEVGLMQIRKGTARGMGYRGSMRALYNPETNIKYGMRYLGKAYRLGGRSTCGAILKYNAGHGAKRMNPISRRYCTKVKRIMRRRG